MINRSIFLVICTAFIFLTCSDDENNSSDSVIQLQSANVGPYNLNLTNQSLNTSTPFDQPIVATFSVPLHVEIVPATVTLRVKGGNDVAVNFTFQDNNKTFVAVPLSELLPEETYELVISNALEGAAGEAFPGFTIEFITLQKLIPSVTVVIDGQTATPTNRIMDIEWTPTIEIEFPLSINTSTITNTTIRIQGATTPTLSFAFSNENKKITVTPNQPLQHLRRYTLSLSNGIEGALGEAFEGYTKIFYTKVDPTPKMPLLDNDEDSDTDNTNDLLSVVQQQTFKYFYDFAHPVSGMARERNTSGDIVTSGGSGFGIMALIVGMERNFITRQQGLDRMDKILDFLEIADRFHGAWPHWMNGSTGDVVPFSANDNGGDLVETSFLVQGLLTFRQYLNAAVPAENDLIDRINVLWNEVEWDWYRRCDPICRNVLYWHWSPDKGWIMNFALSGYFEEHITYFLAASSPTHSIQKNVYTNGFQQNGGFIRNDTYYGYPLKLGGLFPLFWVQYSYLGLNPHFTDDYADYWQQNVNASLINYEYCVDNPKNFVGYSDECWGLTSSDNQSGYDAHAPDNDLGVITPTAALSSFPYTPTESMKALKFFYYTMGDRLWGTYGFYDAFNPTENWYANSYLAIDQGPIIVMIENYRTGLLWDLFMSAPEVQNGMTELNFTPNN